MNNKERKPTVRPVEERKIEIGIQSSEGAGFRISPAQGISRGFEMVAGAEVIHQSVPVLDVPYRCISKGIEEAVDLTVAAAGVAPPGPPPLPRQAARGSGLLSVAVGSSSMLDLRTSDATPNITEPDLIQFVPSIHSGSYADIGPRRYMEDEHIRIDDLSEHFGSMFTCPLPSAFYGIFDGHGGPDAASYIKRHAIRILFEDVEFPQASEADNFFIDSVESSVRKAFLVADLALADDCTVNPSSGTTALAALIFGRLLLVANAGDCRAVLCRKGGFVDMSQDHRPIYASEQRRVEECGGYVDDGYLNGVLSVSRALGDWDIKLSRGLSSPLIAEPEFRQVVLTDDDEFLIIGCDGIWDVMSSQHAVSVVRRGLRRHNDPDRCAKELVMEALRLNSCDNLTVIVVCFSANHLASWPEQQQQQQPPLQLSCSLSMEAICNLRSWLESSNGVN